MSGGGFIMWEWTRL
jgi:hypothetical protein